MTIFQGNESMITPHILVAEDCSTFRGGLAKRIETMGARVTQAEDGQQALEKALAGKFDLVITDVEMPNLDGIGLCEKLKVHQSTKNIPIIFLSAFKDNYSMERGFQVGAAACLTKHEARAHLQDTIKRVLKQSAFKRERLILVADKSPVIRTFVEKNLAEAGFQVMMATDGEQSLKIIRDRRPDLILCGVNIPEINGEDFFRVLHNDIDWASIPIVIMSANSEQAVMRRMLHWGAFTYLAKPLNLEQLAITVERLLSDHSLLLFKDKERFDTEQKMMLASITSLIEALEARDSYTRGHSEAVAKIITGMAVRMNTSPDEIEILGIGGRLHDIGKIGVRDSVLLKKGRLTDEEFDNIKQHPAIGAEILSPIPTLEKIIPVVRHHHERFDGKGYPGNLKGSKIPIWARMTAVADTYHALTSNRPYRKCMPREKALQIIEDVRGSQLCPDCVDIFLEMNFK